MRRFTDDGHLSQSGEFPFAGSYSICPFRGELNTGDGVRVGDIYSGLLVSRGSCLRVGDFRNSTSPRDEVNFCRVEFTTELLYPF